MSEKQVSGAIVALLTVGVLLLNLGADYIKAGNMEFGIPLIITGTALIVTAIFLITLLAKNTAQTTLENLTSPS